MADAERKKRARNKITNRVVDALLPDQIAWDSELSGFGVRCRGTGKKYYTLKYRIAGKQRWYTIGRHGSPWTPELARREAFRLLGEVATDRDPAEAKAERQQDLRVSELCDLYVAEGCATKKTSTLATDRGRIERHIKPLLGNKKVKALARGDVERFLLDVANGRSAADIKTRPRGRAIVKGGKGTATKAVSLLGAMFSFAVDRGLTDTNPVRGVKTFKDAKQERFLSNEEMSRLSAALETSEADNSVNPFVVAAIRLAIFTGARIGEILSLKWDHVDFERAMLLLPEFKTGKKAIYLSPPTLTVLANIPRMENNPYVICGNRPGAALVNIQKPWRRIRAKAGLPDVRIHDLRHSFASVAASGGLSLPMIGKLLGHTQSATTARYAHLAADPVRAANDAIGERIAAAMKGEAAELIGLTRNSQ